MVQHVTGDFGNLLAKGLLFLHSKTEAMPRCKPFLLACEQVNQAAFSRREISIYSPQANLGVRSAAAAEALGGGTKSAAPCVSGAALLLYWGHEKVAPCAIFHTVMALFYLRSL
ncbi:MAG: hypothetical protein E7590_04005 [Ruminococcaceae bacterium]|nr:hypothetical protein [Oscillospiraceae bacterium]